jgi:CheY-like chemotaxis protein
MLLERVQQAVKFKRPHASELRVLVVDDNEAVRHAICGLLEADGAEVVCEAFDSARGEREAIACERADTF